MSHFSDSPTSISGFAVALNLIEHVHANQAEIGIFELFQMSGFISCLALTNIPMIAFSFLVRRCRRTWKVRPSTWTVQAEFGILELWQVSGFISCLAMIMSPMIVSHVRRC